MTKEYWPKGTVKDRKTGDLLVPFNKSKLRPDVRSAVEKLAQKKGWSFERAMTHSVEGGLKLMEKDGRI